MADNDADKWARARAIADADDVLRGQHEDHLRQVAIDRRFAHCRPSKVIQMFETGTNDNGQPLSEFEFQALCERWCAVFGEIPPLTFQPDENPAADPLPPDDAMLNMHDVIRVTGLSETTIKRRMSDPSSDFPRPLKISTRRIAWPAHEIKAWRKRREDVQRQREADYRKRRGLVH